MNLNHIPPFCPCPCHAGHPIFEYIDCCPYIGEQWSAEWAQQKNEEKKVQDLVPPILIPMIKHLEPAKVIEMVRHTFIENLTKDILEAGEIEKGWDKNNRYDEAMETVKDEVPKV